MEGKKKAFLMLPQSFASSKITLLLPSDQQARSMHSRPVNQQQSRLLHQ
jgi:hypothetical protein